MRGVLREGCREVLHTKPRTEPSTTRVLLSETARVSVVRCATFEILSAKPQGASGVEINSDVCCRILAAEAPLENPESILRRGQLSVHRQTQGRQASLALALNKTSWLRVKTSRRLAKTHLKSFRTEKSGKSTECPSSFAVASKRACLLKALL